MAFTSNAVFLDGFMAGNPKKIGDNGPVVFQLSVGKRVKNKETQKFETKYQYIDCKCWGDLREVMAGITDSQRVILSGSLDREEFTDKDDNKRYKLVVLVDALGEVRKIEKKQEEPKFDMDW